MKTNNIIVIILMCLTNYCFSQCQSSGSLFLETYSTSASWFSDNNGISGCGTTNNGTMSVNNASNGVLQFSSVKGGRQNRMFRAIPSLSNQNWTSDFEFKLNLSSPTGCNSSSSPTHMLAGYTASSLPLYLSPCSGGSSCTPCSSYPQSGIDGIWVNLEFSTFLWGFRPYSRDGANTPLTSSGMILCPNNYSGTIYIRLQRISPTKGLLTVCSDNLFTAHFPGSPLCFPIESTVNGLNILQHGVMPQSTCSSVLNAEIDNLKISNALECGMTLTPDFLAPSFICDGSSITVDGTATTGSLMQETDYNWEITQYDYLGNPTGNTWNHSYSGQVGVYTFPSVASGGPSFLTCKKMYYKIKLTVWNCGTLPVSIIKTMTIRCKTPILISASETYLCENTSAILTAEGAQTYVWQPGNLTTNPINVSPNNTTTYTVTGTDLYGCTNTSTITINLFNIPITTGPPYSSGGNCEKPEWRVNRTPSNDYTNIPYSSRPIARGVGDDVYLNPWGSTSYMLSYSNFFDPSSGYSCQAPVGDGGYDYEFQFYLPVLFTNSNLNISYAAADNNMSLSLNGNPTGLTFPSFPGQYVNLTVNSGFVQGINTLVVHVDNSASITGFALVGDFTGCESDISGKQSTSSNFSSSNKSLEISILPNPNSGDFIFSIQSSINANPNLYIMDLFGRILHTEPVCIKEGLTQIPISKQNLPVGVYFVKVDGINEFEKMIIVK